MNATTMPITGEDRVLDDHGVASTTFTLMWSDGRATHEDQMHVEKFSVWREADALPSEIGPNITGMRVGDQVEAHLQSNSMIETWDPTRLISSKPSRFDRNHRPGLVVEPRLGRFYPQGFLHNVQGIFRGAIQPVRITELTPEKMELDLNHPLARFPLQVQFRLDRVLPGFDRRGGRCNSPLDDLLRYPGLSTPLANGRNTDYGDNTSGMSRMDERQDQLFYAKPRLVQHLDARALQSVNALYKRLIPSQAEVLDLMASYDSHLQDVSAKRLHVLGMNTEELTANSVATSQTVQDLNESPALPFETDILDATVCTASVEYLVRPLEVFTEVLRVLRPGGVFALTFSNRWFPTKSIGLWSELHEFERVGLITQWLQQAGFTNLHTFSSQGWPRPDDDPHAGQTLYSDPVYAVWGMKPES